MGKPESIESDRIVVDAAKAARLAAWILSTVVAFVGAVAGGSWAVASWKAAIENHLQRSDDHMMQIDQKLDWIVTAMKTQPEERKAK